MPVPPRTELVEEAQEKLESAIAGYLERRRAMQNGDHPICLFIRSPAGLGKTTSTVALATEYVLEAAKDERPILEWTFGELERDWQPKWLVFTPTHNLAQEIKNKVEESFAENGSNIDIPIWRGRGHNASIGEAPCSRWSEANVLARKGISVGKTLCQSQNGQTGPLQQCEFFDSCEYIQIRKRFAPFTILMTSVLPFAGYGSLRDFSEDQPPGETGFFQPTLDATNYIIDENPVFALIDKKDIPSVYFENIANERLREVIMASMVNDDLLGSLTAAGINQAALEDERLRQKENETRFSQGIFYASPSEQEIEARYGNTATYHLSNVIDALKIEFENRQSRPAYSLRPSSECFKYQRRREFPLNELSGLILDATGDPTILKACIPTLEVAEDIKIGRNAHIIQISDKTFSKYSLFQDQDGESLRLGINQFLGKLNARLTTIGPEERALVVTYKQFRLELTGEEGEISASAPAIDFPQIDIAHFGNIRGIDEFKDHSAIIIIGRQEPSPKDIEDQARAIWFDADIPIQTTAIGGRYPTRPQDFKVRGLRPQPHNGRGVAYHPDMRVNALLYQAREAETVQAIDRLRLIHNERRKTVFILSNIPIDEITVDRLVTWKEFLEGGTKLEKALAQQTERGLNALPLTPAYLFENFPDMWSSRNSARGWFEPDQTGARPYEANKNYMKKVVFLKYRQSGRGGHPQIALVSREIDESERQRELESVLGCNLSLCNEFIPDGYVVEDH